MTSVNDKINFLFKNGYCIIEKCLTHKKCDNLKNAIKKLKEKNIKNKYFKNIDSEHGQDVVRDLVLRDPKNFLQIIDIPKIFKIVKNVLNDIFILDNCMASNSIKVNNKFSRLVHIDSHLPSKLNFNTSDVVVSLCLDDFTYANGATRVWSKSHLSGIRIQNSKNYKRNILKQNIVVDAKKGSAIIFLGHTWHQVGKNINGKDRFSILNHYKKWWIKPATDFTKCGIKIYKMLNQNQKQLFGFNSISPIFNFKKQTRQLKTLRKISDISSQSYLKAKSNNV